MERLRDTRPARGTAEAELVAAVAAVEPVATPPVRAQRILAAVMARAHTRRGRWTAAILLRPVVAAAILVMAGAATAAATVGHEWMARGWHRLTGRTVTAAPPLVPRRVARPRVPPPPASATPPAPTPEAPLPTETAQRPPVVRVSARVRPARGEDPSALVEAVRALRSDHDPRRAARLLDAYLRSYPRGALAEEALALQIEAAANLNSPQAAGFAEQYLRLYPNGRFRQSARQALPAQSRR
jgi:hypothetical protein